MRIALCSCLLVSSQAVRVYPTFASPRAHPRYEKHYTKAPEPEVFSPIAGRRLPGFAAIRGIPMAADSKGNPPLDSWTQMIDLYFNSTEEGGYDLANCIWPGWRTVFEPTFPALAKLLRDRHIPAVDLGGFVPGGSQDFDVNRDVPNAAYLDSARSIMNSVPSDSLYLGLDMGEQDVRYLWGYSQNGELDRPSSHFDQYLRFRDYSWAIEYQSGGIMVSLSSSVYGAHYWHKTGMYTTAGAETSQSNGNTQLLYAFIRGSAKQYGLLWYGQVSIFNTFGYKIPGDPAPSAQCNEQQDHSETCGTSLALMKQLMYTQLMYDSVYFAFEGKWAYPSGARGGLSGITPIGRLQQQAKHFFSSPDSPDLGVHVPTIAVLLDFYHGFARPCDSAPRKYSAFSWGQIPWDGADALADAVFELLFPGYRAAALRRDEQGYLAPTPYGDAVDVLLTDVLPSVLRRYDTLIVAHRLATEPSETRRKLEGFVERGGHLVISASSILDLGRFVASNDATATGFFNLTIQPCFLVRAGTNVTVGNTSVTEPGDFEFCPIESSPPVNVQILAEIGDKNAAVRVDLPSGGTVTVLGAGNYLLSKEGTTGEVYKCEVDDSDSLSKSPAPFVSYAQLLLEGALERAALFDLGTELSWVPKIINETHFSLVVTNPQFEPLPLRIRSRVGTVTSLEELLLDASERNATGYLPHGFEAYLPKLGSNTKDQIAGMETRIFLVTVTAATLEVAPAAATASRNDRAPSTSTSTSSSTSTSTSTSTSIYPRGDITKSASVLLRMSHDIGSLRTELLKRPSFENYFSGVMLDWEYLESRSVTALQREARTWAVRDLEIAVDFTRATTLFPGLRLIDDMRIYYLDSVAHIEDVFAKMAVVGAEHAVFTLHGKSELPPANFTAMPADAARATFESLVVKARALNITLHLRRCSRNQRMIGASLQEQAAFVASVGSGNVMKLAPALAMGDAVSDMKRLIASQQATLLLLSGPWQSMHGPRGGAPLATLSVAQQADMRELVAAMSNSRSSSKMIVLDAVPLEEGTARRDLELVDAAILMAAIEATSTQRPQRPLHESTHAGGQ